MQIKKIKLTPSKFGATTAFVSESVRHGPFEEERCRQSTSDLRPSQPLSKARLCARNGRSAANVVCPDSPTMETYCLEH